MPTPRIEHVNVTVSDPERAAKLMEALFGWHVRWQGAARNGGHTIHVGSDDHYIALYTGRGVAYSADDFAKGRPLNHIGVAGRRPRRRRGQGRGRGTEAVWPRRLRSGPAVLFPRSRRHRVRGRELSLMQIFPAPIAPAWYSRVGEQSDVGTMISRRGVVRGLAGLIAPTLAGCGGSPPPAPVSSLTAGAYPPPALVAGRIVATRGRRARCGDRHQPQRPGQRFPRGAQRAASWPSSTRPARAATGSIPPTPRAAARPSRRGCCGAAITSAPGNIRARGKRRPSCPPPGRDPRPCWRSTTS